MHLSPAWFQVLVGSNISEVMGTKLSNKVDEILSKNQITPANAKNELNELFTK